MAIRFDTVSEDAQGLPVVSWEEDRNLFAPEGAGRARVACFIKPDEKTGVLQFVAAGSVRHGEFEEARPWELLMSFGKSSAEQLYYAAADRVVLDALASKSKSGAGRLLITDSAHVMLANFADEHASVAMHLNCAEALPVEVALLHDRLYRAFIVRRNDLVLDQCNGDYIWPKDKLFVPYAAPEPATLPPWRMRAIDASIAAVLGLIGFGLYWLVLR